MKVKKALSVLLSVLMILGIVGSFNMTANAEKILKSGAYEYEFNRDGTLGITKYTGSAKNLTIPAKINGKKVVAFYNWAFGNNKKLESVVIPKGVTQIGFCAFENCPNLKSVSIPDGVTSIDQEAFYACKKLKNIKLPDSVVNIGALAFENTAYYNTASNWKNNVLYISNHLIKAKKSIKGNYTVKKGTKCIAYSAFAECEKLTGVTIPAGVVTINCQAFFDCKNLKNVVMNSGIKEIGQWAFANCEKLKKINIPKSVTSIDGGAFEDSGYYNTESNWEKGSLYISNCLMVASDATSYTIKKGTRCIADNAFGNDTEAVTIPNSVKNIGVEAFSEYSHLKKVTYKGTTEQWSKIKVEIGNEGLKDNIICCTDGGYSYKISKSPISSIAVGNKSLKAKWTKAVGVVGYEVQVATNSTFTSNKKTVKIVKKGTTSAIIKNLKAKKKYYVRVRSYKNQKVNGKTMKVYSGWSKVKSVKTK